MKGQYQRKERKIGTDYETYMPKKLDGSEDQEVVQALDRFMALVLTSAMVNLQQCHGDTSLQPFTNQ